MLTRHGQGTGGRNRDLGQREGRWEKGHDREPTTEAGVMGGGKMRAYVCGRAVI